MKRHFYKIVFVLLIAFSLTSCGEKTSKDIQNDLWDILPSDSLITINEEGKLANIDVKYGVSKSIFDETIEYLNEQGFKNIRIEFDCKYGKMEFRQNNETQTYQGTLDIGEYSLSKNDAMRMLEGLYPYLISDEANVVLYDMNVLPTDYKEEYTFSTEGELTIRLSREKFMNGMGVSSYDIAMQLFEKDENIQVVSIMLEDTVNGFIYHRENYETVNNNTSNDDVCELDDNLEQNERTDATDDDIYSAVINTYYSLSNYMNGNDLVVFDTEALKIIAENYEKVQKLNLFEAPIGIEEYVAMRTGPTVRFDYDAGVSIIWTKDTNEVIVTYNEE